MLRHTLKRLAPLAVRATAGRTKTHQSAEKAVRKRRRACDAAVFFRSISAHLPLSLSPHSQAWPLVLLAGGAGLWYAKENGMLDDFLGAPAAAKKVSREEKRRERMRGGGWRGWPASLLPPTPRPQCRVVRTPAGGA